VSFSDSGEAHGTADDDEDAVHMPVRVIHRFGDQTADVADLVGYAKQTRDEVGCLEAECFTGLTGEPITAVAELWEGETAYARAWGSALQSRRAGLLFGHGRPESEFYQHRYFHPDDGAWVGDGQAASGDKIFWPAAGPVRVVIQTSMPDVDAFAPGLQANAAETRREPGCVAFEWCRSAESEHHVLLLELWESQALYDAHWALRLRTSPPGPPPSPAPREHGTNGTEFYRYQPFTHLYDRWLPADPSRWSAAVIWPG
jgi:quinol monooxygenase YgiN